MILNFQGKLLIQDYHLLLGVIPFLKNNARHSSPSCNITCKHCLLLGIVVYYVLGFCHIYHISVLFVLCLVVPHLHNSWEVFVYHPTLHSWDHTSGCQFTYILHLGSLVTCLLPLAAVDINYDFSLVSHSKCLT